MKKIAIACALAICAYPFAKADEPAKAPAAAETQSGDEAAIKKTAKKFFTAIMCKGDIDTAKKYMAKETAAMFDALLSLGGPEHVAEAKAEIKKQAKPNAKFSVNGVKIEGNKATAKVTMTVDGESQTDDASFVKEDGQWKVAIEKEGAKKGKSKDKDND